MKVLLIFSMLLSGIITPVCAKDIVEPKSTASDGYSFDKKTFTRYQLQLKIVVIRDSIELRILHDKMHPKDPWKSKQTLKGFTELNENTLNCEIYIVDPQIQYEPEFLGHELVHCMYGYFHKEIDAKN